VSFTPRPLYAQGKSPWYLLDRRLGGPQSRSGIRVMSTPTVDIKPKQSLRRDFSHLDFIFSLFLSDILFLFLLPSLLFLYFLNVFHFQFITLLPPVSRIWNLDYLAGCLTITVKGGGGMRLVCWLDLCSKSKQISVGGFEITQTEVLRIHTFTAWYNPYYYTKRWASQYWSNSLTCQ
jgi:hypothetical protein